MAPFNLETCARPNILSLTPYRCARDDYSNGILLDANENSLGPAIDFPSRSYLAELHRYPDPRQTAVKERLCALRNDCKGTLSPENLFLGVGSDEVIDALMRVFCIPSKDKILICPPTYGMYSVCAAINDVKVVNVPLNPDFSVDVKLVLSHLSDHIKLIYLCSPGNPTGKLIDPQAIKSILSYDSWNGVLVVDEAYIDFSPEGSSQVSLVPQYPNLVVMQTLSKAFGMAGIRMGAAFTSPSIAALLNSIKAPYNISTPTSQLALECLSASSIKKMKQHVSLLIEERNKLVKLMTAHDGLGRILGGLDGNFILVEILGRNGSASNDIAYKVYQELAQNRGIVVRFRGNDIHCNGCVRITVGTPLENEQLWKELVSVLSKFQQI